MNAGKCGICGIPLTAIRIKKRTKTGIVYDFTYYCKRCDKIPKNNA